MCARVYKCVSVRIIHTHTRTHYTHFRMHIHTRRSNLKEGRRFVEVAHTITIYSRAVAYGLLGCELIHWILSALKTWCCFLLLRVSKFGVFFTVGIGRASLPRKIPSVVGVPQTFSVKSRIVFSNVLYCRLSLQMCA